MTVAGLVGALLIAAVVAFLVFLIALAPTPEWKRKHRV